MQTDQEHYHVAGTAQRTRRRLSDRIEEAFDQACDQGQTEVAACMLKGLDLVLLGQPLAWERRKAALSVMRACAARLEHLRNKQRADTEASQ
jgi:hypothetical protein